MSSKLARYILSFVYPVHCPACGSLLHHRESLCQACREQLTPCSDTNSGYCEGQYFCYVYEGVAEAVIHSLKFGNDIIASYAMAEEMAKKLALSGVDRKIDVIVPIPMTRRKRSERGYNQCVWLAREIGRIIGKPCDFHLLYKIRETTEQKTLNYAERQENLSGCFEVRKPHRAAGKRVLLVDDVSTTGATLREAVKTLKAAGAAEVYVAAFAHTVIKNKDC